MFPVLGLAKCCVIPSGDECFWIPRSQRISRCSAPPPVRAEPIGSLQIMSQNSTVRKVHICWWTEVEWSVITNQHQPRQAQMQSWDSAAVRLCVTERWTWLDKGCLIEVLFIRGSPVHVSYKSAAFLASLHCSTIKRVVLHWLCKGMVEFGTRNPTGESEEQADSAPHLYHSYDNIHSHSGLCLIILLGRKSNPQDKAILLFWTLFLLQRSCFCRLKSVIFHSC